jgi:hypothetical protein
MAEAIFVADNEAYIDWWLLEKFPGRTLEELDGVDWLRLQRAMEVDRIVEAEQRRLAYIESGGEGEPDADDWRMWEHHDRLLGVKDDDG